MPVPRSLPELDDEVTFARYPFLPQASGWIQSMAVAHNIDLDELLDGSWMEKARSRARIRLIGPLVRLLRAACEAVTYPLVPRRLC